ncbi:MAG TPA: hypothetical protein VGM86_06915 [Thermoanaerobaculia bacterium]
MKRAMIAGGAFATVLVLLALAAGHRVPARRTSPPPRGPRRRPPPRPRRRTGPPAVTRPLAPAAERR